MKGSWYLPLLFGVLLCASSGFLRGQEDSTADAKANAKEWLDDKPLLDLPAFGQQPVDAELAFFVLTPPVATEVR
jgi:hypothetical protein